ncbi:hypothetical protein [Roseicitreum antarcticum]|nr:hypothetical protein [Roseicitreum antarcticum]
MSVIALPMNLINALAPPVLVALLSEIGVQAVFMLLRMLSVLALGVLLLLNTVRGKSPDME